MKTNFHSESINIQLQNFVNRIIFRKKKILSLKEKGVILLNDILLKTLQNSEFGKPYNFKTISFKNIYITYIK